ncbi:MAG: DUF4296 domain-containing protein [Bacteroidales bacterium]|nr:DUF4296 domain-containing protein [Bacteroidales bacterium]MBN2698563.1 DUF4296 domain-containing protein [Bacteroidales bacterium]
MQIRLKYCTVFFLVILTLIGGCSRKKRISGKEYIEKEVLVDILVDIHLVQSITQDRRYYRKYNFNDTIDMITPIFDKYHVTREQFDSTMAEYTRYPDLLDKVYDEVIMKLNVMIDEIDKQDDPPKKITPPEKLERIGADPT